MTYSLDGISALSNAQEAGCGCLRASVNSKSHTGANLLPGRAIRAGNVLSEVPDKDGEIPRSSRVGVGREANILTASKLDRAETEAKRRP
jgi:hypothetical protein